MLSRWGQPQEITSAGQSINATQLPQKAKRRLAAAFC
jgi:hypothetical protein